MSREQFLTQLRNRLKGLPSDDIEDALEYYKEYLDDAGPENEAATIEAWGNPDQIASQILADYAVKRVNAGSSKKGLSTIWVVILAIFASPIAVPIAAAVVCVIVALVIAIASLVLAFGAAAIGLVAGGLLSIIMGLCVMFQSFPTMIFYVGSGLFCTGFGVLTCVFVVWLSKTGFNGIAKLFSKLLSRRHTV